MGGRIDHHGGFVRVVIRDVLVHIEQVAVFALDDVFAIPFDGIGKIKVNGVAGGSHPQAGVAHFLGVAAGHVTWHQVAETGILLFQEIPAVFFGNLVGAAGVLGILGHPDPAVVPETFTHQGQFGLIIARMRDTCRVNLGKARIGEKGAFLVGFERRPDIAGIGIGGKIKHRAVAPGGQDDRIGGIPFHFTGNEIADDDAPGFVLDDDDVHQLAAGEHFDFAGGNLSG